MSWVSATEPHWVNQHIEAYANIAGPTLGVPKAVSSLLSGTVAAALCQKVIG